MSRNKKVPLNCSSEGTSKLLLIGVKNNNATNLYTKRTFISSHVLNCCNSYQIIGSLTWLEVE